MAPSSFTFSNGKFFRMGETYGAASFVQILAPELNDRMLAEFLDMEASLIVNLHIQSVDQVRAIKTIKRKITDLDRAKIEEQKKAVRAGYDMDIIPSDLATYGSEAKKLLQDLQSRNERMFLLTFLVLNTAESKRQLDNQIFQTGSIAQKHNCVLTRLDFQQEEGLMSSLPLGLNQIDIQRGLTTSSTAIFIPFTTQELFQNGKEAQYVATALEIYVTGSLNVFNHRTNVNIDNRMVCYDIKELGKQLKKIGMLVVQDQIWNRVTINRGMHRSTRYYVDELHLLLRKEQTAAYTIEIWKRFRKWGGIPTGITQNIKDLLASREIENIFENSDYIYMLNQASGDRSILAAKLNISPHQLSYVTQSGEGEGLLFYGNVILPFVDHFPRDTELYGVMTTKPSDQQTT